MKISVICPTYNSEKYIEKTFLSVVKQTRLPDELILVDDGSTDRTIEFLESQRELLKDKLKIIIITGQHKGPGAARNKGIKAASSDWIAFLDSDDIWEHQKLEEIEKSISSSGGVNFICHNEIFLRKNGKKKKMEYGRKFQKNIPLFNQLFYSNMFSTSAVVCKRSLLIDDGLFDEDLLSAQDYDLWIRLSKKIKPLFLDKELGYYIERDGNITSGSLVKRLRNEIKIALKHRAEVQKRELAIRFLRIFASYAKQTIFRIFPG